MQSQARSWAVTSLSAIWHGQLRVGSSSSRLEGSTTRSLMVSGFSISSEGLIMGKCVRPWSKLRQHLRRCYGKSVSYIATEGLFSFCRRCQGCMLCSRPRTFAKLGIRLLCWKALPGGLLSFPSYCLHASGSSKSLEGLAEMSQCGSRTHGVDRVGFSTFTTYVVEVPTRFQGRFEESLVAQCVTESIRTPLSSPALSFPSGISRTVPRSCACLEFVRWRESAPARTCELR